MKMEFANSKFSKHYPIQMPKKIQSIISYFKSGDVKRITGIIWKVLKIAIPTIVLLPLVLTIAYKVVPAVSTLMIYQFATGKSVERDWLPLSETSENLQRAVVMSEDGKFCEHYGVDWEELKKQIDYWNEGRRPRGASTISMQLAKNLFLWHGRSYSRKILELPLALWIDLLLGKKRLMEIYLNSVEWGDGIFGANAATKTYFGKSAESLTRWEAALMAAALPNPIVRNPERPNSTMRRHANRIVRRMSDADSYLGCLFD